jgi:hypothetical protein
MKKKAQAPQQLDALAYVAQNGDVPKLSDGKGPKPWHYRGWLVPYISQIDDRFWGRYRYHKDTIEAGRLLDAPIPRIAFSRRATDVTKHLNECCRLIGYDNGGWGDFTRLLEWLCFAVRASSDYPRHIDEKAQEALYRKLNVGPMIQQPYDYLGDWVAERIGSGSWNPNAFFPTPHEVVELMVQMQMGQGEDLRAKTVCDPCTGSGRMLMHASNYSLRLYGIDIDPIAVAMCKINAALYVPWLAFPIPDAFFVQRYRESCSIFW